MARILSILAVFVAALALASGARQPLQAATTLSADVVFIMEAAQATFTNATTLALDGLTSSAQSYGARAKTGIYPIQNFTDGSASSEYVDSNGEWLSNPQAVMYAVGQEGNVTTVLLTLSNPTAPPQPAAGTTTNNNNNKDGGSTITNNNDNGPAQLTFTVALVPADASKVKYQKGVVAAKVAEASAGVGNLAQAITPGATFGPVAFYIDQNQQGLPKKATTKWGGGGWGNYGGGGYNSGWGHSSSNNNNNNNNNGGYRSSNNNNNNNNNSGGYRSSNNNNNNNNGGGRGSNNNNNNNNNNGGGRGSNNNNNNNNGK